MPTGHLFQEIPWETTMEAYYHRESNGEREPMFEKPLTPSDVGKLNRLVIPKQHAEKYFPLAADSDKKGSLLSFQDEAGKLWWFRYSYWTSSQSYVLTKGWSRFVKEKQLDAGDVVLFERTTAEDRLFIRCRRRADTVQSPCTSSMQQEYLLQRGEQSVAVPKRLRLFGVNLECMPEQAEPETVHSAAWFIGHKHVQRGLNWSEE